MKLSLPVIQTLLLLTIWPMMQSARANTTDLDASFQISGSADDISANSTASGLTFQVGLRGITYSGQVERTLLENKHDGTLTIWLALRNVRLTIQRTDLTAQRRSAQCGPLQIVMGNRQELWIALDAKVLGRESGNRLELTDVRFELPEDNWNVGPPAWVNTRGLGMSKANVIGGLTNGLAGKRKEIEAQMIKVAPAIFSQTISYLKRRHADQEVALK